MSPYLRTAKTAPGRRIMRGDRVEVAAGTSGEVRAYEVAASRNGRGVDINTGRATVNVTGAFIVSRENVIMPGASVW